MEFWETLPAAGGQPTRGTLFGDFEIATVPSVGLYDGDEKLDYEGTITLTAVYLRFEDLRRLKFLQLPLERVHIVAKHRGFGTWSHPKITVSFANGAYCKLSFRGGYGTCDAFHEKLTEGLEAKTWLRFAKPVDDRVVSMSTKGRGSEAPEQTEPAAGRRSPTPTPSPSLLGIGVSGIIKKSETTQRVALGDIDRALQDMDSLMANATTLVQTVAQLKANLGAVDESDGEKLAAWSLALGLPAPVTAATVGKGGSFHGELARELERWLQKSPSHNRLNAIPLIELYAAYNRARGTDLLSPTDVLAACEALSLMEHAAYGLRKVGGVYVLQKRMDGKLLVALTRALGPRGVGEDGAGAPDYTRRVVPLDVAAAMGVGQGPALELLLDQEMAGVLCRSERNHCLSFHWNFFVDAYASTARS